MNTAVQDAVKYFYVIHGEYFAAMNPRVRVLRVHYHAPNGSTVTVVSGRAGTNPCGRPRPCEPELLLQAFALPHRILSVDENLVGIMDNPVQNSVGKRTFADFGVPACR